MYFITAAIILLFAAIIGKTTITENTIYVERPYTAMAFVVMAVLGLMGK